MLKRVFINIFDFLETFRELFKNPRKTDLKEVLRPLKNPARELRFKNDMMLGVYSSLTSRVFPRKRANPKGTLALLLRPIGGYLGESDDVMQAFKRQAGGGELQEAKKGGHAGVREFLQSRDWPCFHSEGPG